MKKQKKTIQYNGDMERAIFIQKLCRKRKKIVESVLEMRELGEENLYISMNVHGRKKPIVIGSPMFLNIDAVKDAVQQLYEASSTYRKRPKYKDRVVVCKFCRKEMSMKQESCNHCSQRDEDEPQPIYDPYEN